MEQHQFIDLQVNGYGGVDFNSDGLTADQLRRACVLLREQGTSQVLATLITDDLAAMRRRAKRLSGFIRSSPDVARTLVGIHLEGPFISPAAGYVGAHPAAAVRPASVEDAKLLIDSCEGLARLVTLAPEHDEQAATTHYLADQGVIVSAGHCNPSADDLDRASDAGLSMFTHLGNGCPLELPRHDNIIQRVLSRADRLRVCMIADGVHIPFFALKNYLQAAGLERTIVVSDAIAAAGCGAGEYELAGQRVVVDENLATWSQDRSHLVGSALSLPRAFQNLREQVGLSEADALRLTVENPRAALEGT
ncbi:N-acetylglucosamine-6-phosphate deacetylase [Posidoniimonas corsicana]|uniref:N-acetylglucosamine-6-phosphate deacetylase n=1 Tax=Posidoniimonas corsicana TaxID=1938618 RepID=A0A5C5VFP2_9BACT|nr:N-acetylglucosamine-6-phosphate deacetylase [Posidoniimonas corsicana]TWT36472.1 N-acetylglucosamine-6-phosphate deacetylase [Posidoniimonas corsicana]